MLARSAPERAMALALEAFDDPAPRVRVAAVQALGRVGGKTAIPYLRRALQDKDLTVRAFAAGHLGVVVSDRKRKGEN
jgi:HEAT repeat protein